MTKKVSPIPRGYRTVTPCLTVLDVDSAIAFYQVAFGADLLNKHTGADDSVSLHATIKIGNSMIVLSQEAPDQGILSPLSSGVRGSQIHLYVDDVDDSWNRAIEAGAIVHTDLYDAYWGDRTGMLIDTNGQLWSIASKIENVSKDEIVARSKAALKPVEEFPIDSAIDDVPYFVEPVTLAEQVVEA